MAMRNMLCGTPRLAAHSLAMVCRGRRDAPAQRGTYGMQAALTVKGQERRVSHEAPK